MKSYLLPERLNGNNYFIFVSEVLPQLLLQNFPQYVRDLSWFQHDGAPAHFTRNVRDWLDGVYPNRWIGRGGPISWPARSPDMTPLDFYFWGHLKSMVYETPVTSEIDLIGRIVEASARIRETPGVFERVRQSFRRRIEGCIEAEGRQFEHLL